MSSTPTLPHSTASPGATSSSRPTLVLTNQELVLGALARSLRRLGQEQHGGALGQHLIVSDRGRHDLVDVASICGRALQILAMPATDRRPGIACAGGTRGRGRGAQQGRGQSPRQLPPMRRAPGTSAASSRSAGPTSTSGATTNNGSRRDASSLLAAINSASRTTTSTAMPIGSSSSPSTRPSTTTPIVSAVRALLARCSSSAARSYTPSTRRTSSDLRPHHRGPLLG